MGSQICRGDQEVGPSTLFDGSKISSRCVLPKSLFENFDFSMQTKFEPEDFQCLGFEASTYDATIKNFKEQETHRDQTTCPAAWMGPCCKVCNGS